MKRFINAIDFYFLKRIEGENVNLIYNQRYGWLLVANWQELLHDDTIIL